MQHMHVADVRPDAIWKTGVIQPFPIDNGPAEVAAKTVQSFNVIRREAPSYGFSGLGDPPGYIEPQPEEVAMMANRLATAMMQGLRPIGVIDPKLVQAAELIMRGQDFIVRSAGRAAIVRAAGSARSVDPYVPNAPF